MPWASFGACLALMLSRSSFWPVRSILSGVLYLHEHDIVHRDLKCVSCDPPSGTALIAFSQTRKHPLPHQSPRQRHCHRRFRNACLVPPPFEAHYSHSVEYRAKHLHTPDEQLHSLAGSFGYVAPEVLNKGGHGKAVDIWSTGSVTMASSDLSSLIFGAQNHHIRPSLRVLPLPLRRRQDPHPGDDRGED